MTLGYVNENGYKTSSTKGRIFRKSNKQPSRKNIIESFNFTAFKDEIVVFTGRLASMTRG